MHGKLYIIATPIGNLSDITLRALETLKNVDRIVAEDTRVTRKLLSAHEVDKPLTSLRERSPRAQFEKIADTVAEGNVIAYVTDAGTPGISDPGNLLVSLVRKKCGEGAIVPIPGPSSLSAAISVAGLNLGEFLFLGFLPHKKGRETLLNEIAKSKRPVLLFESPHRMQKLFESLSARIPDRDAVIFRELTKFHEQIASGSIAELKSRIDTKDIPLLGEFVVAIAR